MKFPETRCIDIGPLFRGEDFATDQAVASALLEDGGFLAIGFPGSDETSARMGKLFEFLNLADADKLACATFEHAPENKNIYRGYCPFPKEPNWSYSETFDIGPEPPMTSPDVAGADSFREPNSWPDADSIPGWQTDLLQLMARQRKLALMIIASIARGLDMEERLFLAPSSGRNGTIRMLHYMPAPEGYTFISGTEGDPIYLEDGRRLLTRSHVDTGLLALLWQNDIGGLQLKSRDGTWREVPRISNGLSVHCGDLLEPLSEGKLKGTVHRVVGYENERCSLGYWLEPDFDTHIVPPGQMQAVSYAQHLSGQFPARFVKPDSFKTH